MKYILILLLLPFTLLAQTKITIRANKKVQVNNIPKPPTRIAYFGDSYTAGLLTYPNKVNANNGIPFTNYAVGGTSVSTNTYAPTGGNNLIDKYTTEVNLGYTGQLVCFAYGTNDAAAGVVNSTWKATYKSIIQSFITAGFPAKRLLIQSVPAYSTLAAGKALARQYSSEIASELGISYYDVFLAFKNTGVNDSYFSASDGYVHPTDAGQIIWTQSFYRFLNR